MGEGIQVIVCLHHIKALSLVIILSVSFRLFSITDTILILPTGNKICYYDIVEGQMQKKWQETPLMALYKGVLKHQKEHT